MCILFHTAIHQSIFRLGLSCPLRMHEYEHLILLYCPLFCCCCCLPYFAAMKLRQFTCMQRGKGSFTACTLFDIYTIFSCCFFFSFLFCYRRTPFILPFFFYYFFFFSTLQAKWWRNAVFQFWSCIVQTCMRSTRLKIIYTSMCLCLHLYIYERKKNSNKIERRIRARN